jgi:hypothetical protein
MELVEGPTGQRMERGRIPVPEALAIGRQIAVALEYAHQKGNRPSGSEAGQRQAAARWGSKCWTSGWQRM